MKGDASVIAALNAALASELTSIDFYWLNWRSLKVRGYRKLGHKLRDLAGDEKAHVKALMARIYFLEGLPLVKHDAVALKADVAALFTQALSLENTGHDKYDAAIKAAAAKGDAVTNKILFGIQKDEEDHILWFEQQQRLVKDLGMTNYLTEYAD